MASAVRAQMRGGRAIDVVAATVTVSVRSGVAFENTAAVITFVMLAMERWSSEFSSPENLLGFPGL